MLLETRHLKKVFGRMPAVWDVSLTVREGELKSIIGPNGAGKTTFFNLLTGRIVPTSGEIFFRGKEITKKSPSALVLKGLSRSFQIVSLFPDMTVSENLWASVQTTDRFRASWWRRVSRMENVQEGVGELLVKLGLEEQRDVRAKHLSYGDQRILEIGLALGTKPKLLLLDEPTSGMSPLEAGMTLSLIKELAKEVTILLIEHNMKVVMSVSDRIAVMHHGKLIADGTPADIASNPRVRQAYLGTAQ